MKHLWDLCRRNVDSILSPRGLLARATLLLVTFAVFHLAGGRRFTSILCGMDPSAGQMPAPAALLGLLYVLCYLGAVVIAPIFILAAAILATWNRLVDGELLTALPRHGPDQTRRRGILARWKTAGSRFYGMARDTTMRRRI